MSPPQLEVEFPVQGAVQPESETMAAKVFWDPQ
jgi:hypothetical protein